MPPMDENIPEFQAGTREKQLNKICNGISNPKKKEQRE
jgi:hypothetical protein